MPPPKKRAREAGETAEPPSVIAVALGAGGDFDLRSGKRRRMDAAGSAAAVALAVDGVDAVLCAHEIGDGVLLCSAGSVVDCTVDAIVNAANEGCQGGGGVDGAITAAGGEALAEARAALPRLAPDDRRRCATGGAVFTVGGDLGARFCVHAVGPNYLYEPYCDDLAAGDACLADAYAEAMACAREAGARTVAFSLLSSGIFRGCQKLRSVLDVAVAAVAAGGYAGLERVHLVAFTAAEQRALAAAADRRFRPSD